ncbi:hypothetical protein ES754_02465 [Psychrobacter frigidicola]|uniref:Pentapeptide MXKDX repeat protein n=1 Tax=Psychrobacter frigidicola TaxID=45611 RepID=A0A5C7A422_9GAMM|nr:hypothetical protein [Psychrobacter frigidicola]TXD97848.1 hypothetical protein ES754_02465 [Psychrobacter frigidicola]
MWLTKSLVATALALTVSACAVAHDSNANNTKMPMQQGQMDCAKMGEHMKMMQNMDHDQMMKGMGHSKMGQMDMNDPAMKKAMMANMSKMQQMYQQQCVTNKNKS